MDTLTDIRHDLVKVDDPTACAVHASQKPQEAPESEETFEDDYLVPRAKFGALCGSCYGRIRHFIMQSIPLIEYIRSQVAPAMQAERGPRVSGTRDQPIPFRTTRTEKVDGEKLEWTPVEDADRLYCTIFDYSTYFSRLLGVDPTPVTYPYLEADRDCDGLPKRAWTPKGARVYMRSLAYWYRDAELTIVNRTPSHLLVQFHNDIVDTVRDLQRAYPTAPRPDRPARGVCPTCLVRAVKASFYADGTAYVECENCRETNFPAPTVDGLWAMDEPVKIGRRHASPACAAGKHPSCRSFNCGCDSCHDYPTQMKGRY